MALNANSIPSAPRPKLTPDLEAGTYPFRLVGVATLGIQTQRPFVDRGVKKEKPPVLEVELTWEACDEFLVDKDGNELEDKPRWLSERMPFHNLQAERAKSTQRYLAMDPKMEHNGDFGALLGTPVNLEVGLDEWEDRFTKQTKTKNTIKGATLMRPKDAAKLPDLVNPMQVFDFDNPDETSMAAWDRFPAWKQDRIKGALNFPGSDLEAVLRTHVPAEREKPAESDEDVSEGEVAEKEDEAVETPVEAPVKTKPKAAPKKSAAEDLDDEIPW